MLAQSASSGTGGPRWWSYLAFLGLLIGVVVAVGVLVSLKSRGVEYAVVMDSGSTGACHVPCTWLYLAILCFVEKN